MHPLLMRKRGYRMTFAAGLPASITAGLGTVGVSGGALVATGIAVPTGAPNLASNPEFTADTAGWTAVEGATATRRDSTSAPGALSPSADKWCLEVAGTSVSARVQQSVTTIIGASYTASTYLFSPATNAESRKARLQVSGAFTAASDASADGAWVASSVLSGVATTTALLLRLENRSVTEGDLEFFDGPSFKRQNAIAWFPPVGVNLRLPVALAMPAAPDVTPIDIIVRATDALNYWAVRIKPNTAGNDTEIVEVVAGVETVRAAADVDWTAGGTDYVLLDVRGTALTVYAMKQGASVWTIAASYATMATQLNSTGIGVQYYSTTAGPTLVSWEAQAL